MCTSRGHQESRLLRQWIPVFSHQNHINELIHNPFMLPIVPISTIAIKCVSPLWSSYMYIKTWYIVVCCKFMHRKKITSHDPLQTEWQREHPNNSRKTNPHILWLLETWNVHVAVIHWGWDEYLKLCSVSQHSDAVLILILLLMLKNLPKYGYCLWYLWFLF